MKPSAEELALVAAGNTPPCYAPDLAAWAQELIEAREMVGSATGFAVRGWTIKRHGCGWAVARPRPGAGQWLESLQPSGAVVVHGGDIEHESPAAAFAALKKWSEKHE